MGAATQLTDAVEKVRGLLPARANRIATTNSLNRYYVFGFCIESILLGKTREIFFRQHRPEADMNNLHKAAIK
jgi:hypothetical protein